VEAFGSPLPGFAPRGLSRSLGHVQWTARTDRLLSELSERASCSSGARGAGFIGAETNWRPDGADVQDGRSSTIGVALSKFVTF